MTHDVRQPKHALALFARLVVPVVAAAMLGGAARGEPDVPAIDRDVALVRDDEFTYPHIPPLRTTADGRIGIGPRPIDGMVRFHALVPESMTAALVDGPPGDHILAGALPFEVPESRFHGAIDNWRRHYALCDTTAEFPTAGELTNPYACGYDHRDDCYDFTVVTSARLGDGSKRRRLWGTPVTVRVAEPKTTRAAIARVVTGTPRPGATFGAQFFFEAMTTGDGRLLSGRFASDDFEWAPPGGVARIQPANLVYAFNGDGDPCDVRAWQDFHPISHAPYDPEVSARYGFAMQPFRDAMGRVLPDGDDLGISYPWIDRHGRNLFFTALRSLLSKYGHLPTSDANTRYPTRCIPGAACEERPEYYDATRGLGVVGLWTRGKMVLLDGILNNIDYGLELDEGGHRLVKLFAAGTGARGDESGEVRLGTGRGSADDAPSPATYIGNPNIVDSLENAFNALPAARPVTPRDITWIVNSGKASDEITFDDWLDLDAIIVSEMVGATSYRRTLPNAGIINYEDGWWAGVQQNPVLVQNAATTPPERWHVPEAGVTYGDVRLEPAALGGVRGKGFWLDGRAGIEYELAPQRTGARETPWYLAIFLDPRFADDGATRTLLSFAGGASIALDGRSTLLYARPDGTIAHRVDLGTPLPHRAWSHLGFQILPEGAGIVFYRDGFAFDFAAGDVDSSLLPSPGSLFVGDDPRTAEGGVRGWIDGFVLIARQIDPEQTCNHAGGTLAEIDDGAPRQWIDTAQLHPEWAHEGIGARSNATSASDSNLYVCFHGYDRDYQAHTANLPAGLRSVRREIVFPEGPLGYGHPRPDSSENAFCLSCHSPHGRGGLSSAALTHHPGTAMEDDPRRQPSQPTRRVFGNVPADWLGDNKPPRRVEAPPAGLEVDALQAGVVAPVEAAPAPPPCIGDCDGNLAVTVGELTLGARIALDTAPFAQCRRAYECGTGANCLGVAQLTRAVRNALDGCVMSSGALPSP